MLELATITANEISKCLRCRDIITGEVYYDVRLNEKTSHHVFSNKDFGFFCTCGDTSGLCCHALWSLATAQEIRRIEQVSAGDVTITGYSPGQWIDLHYTTDGVQQYCVSLFHSQGQYYCSCPAQRTYNILCTRDTCAHVQAVKKHNSTK